MATFEELANPGIGALGIYEPGKPIEEVARELGFDDPATIIKLASNENALGPSPRALRAMRQALTDMHRYPDGGSYYLRHKLADSLQLTPEHILPGNGSNELIELLGHVFLNERTSIVMAAQAFVVYRLVAAMFRARTIAVPMREFTHDLEAMRAAITPDTRLVFVSNPNNPTSTMVDGAAIDRFMDGIPGHVVVCFDEAYIELLSPERQPDTLKYVRDGRNVIVLRTFSKTYGLAGLRLGYGIAPPECVRLMNRVRQPFNVNALAQAGALAALADGAHVEKTRRLVAEGLAYFEREFDRLGLPYVPGVANFILVKVGAGREVFKRLQQEGIIVRPVDGYGLPDYIRITVGTDAENRRCMRALRRVLKAAVKGDPRR